jgi:hypothetical protein
MVISTTYTVDTPLAILHKDGMRGIETINMPYKVLQYRQFLHHFHPIRIAINKRSFGKLRGK